MCLLVVIHHIILSNFIRYNEGTRMTIPMSQNRDSRVDTHRGKTCLFSNTCNFFFPTLVP